MLDEKQPTILAMIMSWPTKAVPGIEGFLATSKQAIRRSAYGLRS
jgi:hypothetical protein